MSPSPHRSSHHGNGPLWAVPIPWLVLTVGMGGFAPWVLIPSLLVCAALALLAAWSLPSQWRAPAWGWPLAILLPAAIWVGLGAAPLGIGNPLSAADREALGVPAQAWAIDPDAAAVATAWGLAMAAFALAACTLLRGHRARLMLMALTVIGAIHAVAAIVLSAAAPDLLGTAWASRVRGAFVYPNHAAASWACLLPAALWLAGRSSNPLRWSVVVAALLAGVVLSASRGAIVVAALVTVPWWWRALPGRHRVLWAGGLALAVVGFLLALNLDQVRNRFGQWESAGDALGNARFTIYADALPTIAESPWIGSGAGGTIMAWRRHGSGAFDRKVVDHLHQDYLQWQLERGAIGSLLLLVGLAIAAISLRRRWPEMSEHQRGLCMAALGGVAVLTVHGGVDLIWQSPAIACQGILLLSLAAAAMARNSGSQSTHLPRAMLVGLAVTALLAASWAAPIHHELSTTSRLQKAITERERAGIDPLSLAGVERLLSSDPRTGQLAQLKAGLGLAQLRRLLAQDPELGSPAARRLLRAVDSALHTAALRRPGSAGAWIERLRLVMIRQGRDEIVPVALERLAAWAPNWRATQLVRLQLAALRPDAMGQETIEQALNLVLQSDIHPPSYLPNLAQRHLGTAATAAALARANAVVARVGLHWAQTQASRDEWLRIRAQAHPGIWAIPRAAWLCSPQLNHPVRVAWSMGEQQRSQQALELVRAGLPLPPGHELSAVSQQLLAGLGVPASTLLSDAIQRQALRDLAGSYQHHDLGRLLWERLMLAESLLKGEVPQPAPDRHGSDLLAAALSLEGIDHHHLRLILRRHQQPQWRSISGGGRWTWLWIDEETIVPYEALPRWTARIVDGQMVDWLRGSVDPSEGLGLGLHRVVLADP